MSHLLKYTEWQSASGKWYCNDVLDLAGISGKWWVPARMLNMKLTDYILMLQETFHATIVSYNSDTDILFYSFNSYTDVHAFVLWINKMARKANFLV